MMGLSCGRCETNGPVREGVLDVGLNICRPIWTHFPSSDQVPTCGAKSFALAFVVFCNTKKAPKHELTIFFASRPIECSPKC
jgi:hypothetical protein